MAAQQYQYRRAAHAGKLTGVALEVADKARVTGKPLPDVITLNPVGLGYFPYEEIKATQNKQDKKHSKKMQRNGAKPSTQNNRSPRRWSRVSRPS